MVLLPDPLGPTMAVVAPFGITRLRFMSILTSCRVGYAKLIPSITIFSSRETSASRIPFVHGFGASMIVKNMEAALMALEAAVNGTETALMCASMVMTDISTLTGQILRRGHWIRYIHHQGFDVGEFEVQIQSDSVPEAQRKRATRVSLRNHLSTSTYANIVKNTIAG
jgi:hypothetical protein